MVEAERVQRLNETPARPGAYVLYWMQAAARAADNPALEHAVAQADELRLPLLAVFGLIDDYPEANLRHYRFLLEGLRDARRELAGLGVQLAVQRVGPGGPAGPAQAALSLSGEAALVVTDRGHLRHQRSWRAQLAAAAPCPVVQVETELVVPLEQASSKLEWSAATLRPKIRRRLEQLDPHLGGSRERPPARGPRRDSLGLSVPGALDLEDLAAVLAGLRVDRGVPPVPGAPGGAQAARELLARFTAGPLRRYHLQRSDPGLGVGSGLSPYLHFGHISPLTVARAVRRARGAPLAAREAFLEELIVRRELAFNLAAFEPAYDRYEGLPAWARQTLARHARDPRPHLYERQELEAAATHDPYWNAAMREMLLTGRMHGYMRMYWGKKILQWSPSPEQAFRTALELNNRYFLDGRDPNSYAGVAWCFGRHDRPWPERPVYGTVRAMTDSGLRRKFDMQAYLERVAAIPSGGEG